MPPKKNGDNKENKDQSDDADDQNDKTKRRRSAGISSSADSSPPANGLYYMIYFFLRSLSN